MTHIQVVVTRHGNELARRKFDESPDLKGFKTLDIWNFLSSTYGTFASIESVPDCDLTVIVSYTTDLDESVVNGSLFVISTTLDEFISSGDQSDYITNQDEFEAAFLYGTQSELLQGCDEVINVDNPSEASEEAVVTDAIEALSDEIWKDLVHRVSKVAVNSTIEQMIFRHLSDKLNSGIRFSQILDEVSRPTHVN